MNGRPSILADALVTVVVPAYNAEDTIDETLRSVRAQTHRNLEIIVVDDGSRDATADIAARHAADDNRLRVVRQDNAGVAAARNTGWRMGGGDVFSFVDADDLWSPEKTAEQLAVMRAKPDVDLVYSWYVIIDGDSRITLQWPGEEWEGDVLSRLLVSNFIGNGSSVMVTRQALESAGGFEPGLRGAGAQGCEDILFYCRVAEHHRFALAPGYFIGYRYIDGNMSSDLPRMLRSWLLVLDEMGTRHPDKRAEMATGFDRFSRWLVRRAVQLGQPRYLPGLFTIMARRAPVQAVRIMASEVPKAISDFHHPLKNRSDPASAADMRGPRFAIAEP